MKVSVEHVNAGGNLNIKINSIYYGAEFKKDEAPFLIPYPPNPNFVGRNEELNLLHSLLQPGSDRNTMLVGLSGLGGVGKTQIAAEYAHKYRSCFPDGVFWVNAAQNLSNSFAVISQYMGLSTGQESFNEQILLGWKYFTTHPHALLILDNLFSLSDLDLPILPGFSISAVGCRVIFTTRESNFGCRFTELPVKSFSEEISLRLLLRSNDRKYILDKTNPEHDIARRICILLGHLPLAVELAASYIGQYPEISLSLYLERLIQEGAIDTVDDNEFVETPTKHKSAIRATLLTSWNDVKDQNARLVFCAAGQLPEAEYISNIRLGLLTNLSYEAALGRPSPISRALKKLEEVSLIEKLGSNAINLHPLVHEFAKNQVPGFEEIIDFRFSLARNAFTTIGSLDKLELHVQKRGIDDVLGDLRTVTSLVSQGEIYQKATLYERILDRESIYLRGWDYIKQPDLFFQRVHISSMILGDSSILEEVKAHFNEKNTPSLRLLWHDGSEDINRTRTLQIQDEALRSVAISPDGKTVAIGSGELYGSCYYLKIFDFQTGKEIRTLVGHKERAEALAFTPDGKKVISASVDKTLKVWDLETGKVIHTLEGHTDRVVTVVLFNNGKYAASGSWDATIKIWDLDDGKLIKSLDGYKSNNPHESNYVLELAVSSDESLLASASGMGSCDIKLWDLNSMKEIESFKGSWDNINTVSFLPDNKRLVSGARSAQRLKLWDLQTAKEIYTVTLGATISATKDLVLTPDGSKIVTASGKEIIVWETSTGKIISKLGSHSEDVNAVAITPDGKWIISASEDGTAKVWALESATPLQQDVRHSNKIKLMEISLDGTNIITGSIETSKDEKVIYDWNMNLVVPTWDEIKNDRTDPYSMESGRTNPPTSIVLIKHDIESGKATKLSEYEWKTSFANYMGSNLMKTIIIRPYQNIVGMGEGNFLWGIFPGDAITNAKENNKYFLCKVLLTLPFCRPVFIKRVIINNHSSILETFFEINSNFDFVYSLITDIDKNMAFLTNSRRYCFLLSREGILIVNWETGERKARIASKRIENDMALITDVAITDDDKYLGVAFDSSCLEIWDFKKREFLYMLHGLELINFVEFTFGNQGLWLVARYENGVVMSWDVTTGKLISKFDCPAKSSYSTLALDGTHVVYIDDSSTIKVTNLLTKTEVSSFKADVEFNCIVAHGNKILVGDITGCLWTFDLSLNHNEETRNAV